jgi:CRISPR/Cas system CSM-associated protein Csm3 (group 7 of RAMP superfamily)
VFGYGGGRDEGESAVGMRAAVRVADAVVSGAVPTERKHVAIDRFTGGALDKALFAMEVLEDGTFPLTVEWMLGAREESSGGDDFGRQVRAVLRLVLEDLNDGIIGMGGGTARGYGSVAIDFDGAVGLPEAQGARRELAAMVRGGANAG